MGEPFVRYRCAVWDAEVSLRNLGDPCPTCGFNNDCNRKGNPQIVELEPVPSPPMRTGASPMSGEGSNYITGPIVAVRETWRRRFSTG